MLPLILGVLVALGGVSLLADARLPDSAPRVAERRRRQRTERSRAGEAWIGIGLLAVGAALIGRDGWRWGNVAVLVGVVCLAAGVVLNRRYLYEMLFFRGPARRGRSADRAEELPPTARPRRRG
jgi:hypothetical protein